MHKSVYVCTCKYELCYGRALGQTEIEFIFFSAVLCFAPVAVPFRCKRGRILFGRVLGQK